MTGARILTAAILIPFVIALVLWAPTWLVTAAAAAIAYLALREFFVLGDRLGMHAYRVWTSIAAVAIFAQQWAAGETKSWELAGHVRLTQFSAGADIPLDLLLMIFLLGVTAIIFVSKRPLAEALGDIGVSSAGLLFVALPLSAAVRIEAIPMIGRKLLLFTLVFVWVGDTAAYFVGRSLGRTKMAPQLSPKKTWEGAAANLLGSLVVALCFLHWLGLDLGQVLAMAALGNIAGQAGDLLKSAYKRGAGVKDSGTLLPGHGGVLDRIDALILAAPVVWYYFQMVVAPRG